MMNREQLTELVLEKVTSIAFRDSHSENASLADKFRGDLGFDSLDSYELSGVLADELSKRTDECVLHDDFDVFWADFDATVQDLVNYIAEKLAIE